MQSHTLYMIKKIYKIEEINEHKARNFKVRINALFCYYIKKTALGIRFLKSQYFLEYKL